FPAPPSPLTAFVLYPHQLHQLTFSQCNTTPEKCCLKFSTNAIPVKNVTEILRTSSCCSHGAFIVTTTKGKEVCFKDDFKWAKRIFDRLSKDKEASGSS
uniref:Chemokine interleukin-8-like domain-containing protein n=1 Tax=Oryzias melastigma TaxID=30732 RepID=A0A3B3DUQ3_ORYME